MPEAPRTQRYDGLFPSQTQELFDADARSAAEHDWYPVSETWQGSTLFVVYAQDPGRGTRTTTPSPAAKPANGPTGATGPTPATGAPAPEGADVAGGARAALMKLATGFAAGTAMVAALALLMVGWNSWDRPGNTSEVPIITPTPGPTFLAFVDATATPVSHVTAPGVATSPAPASSPRPPGVRLVGTDILPGTYRAVDAGGCYWARLSGLTGSPYEVISSADAAGPAIVTIGKHDVAFQSERCGTWTTDLRRITDSRTAFIDGTYQVGTDIAPGSYKSGGGSPCYWARLSGFGGTPSDVIADDIASGGQVVTIRSSDTGFTSAGCGAWVKR